MARDGYRAVLSPTQQGLEKATGGLAVVTKKDGLTVVMAAPLTEAFKEFYDVGRLARYQIDLGGTAVIIVNLYAHQGAMHDRSKNMLTEQMMMAIEEELEKISEGK